MSDAKGDHAYVINVMSGDHPGIVSTVTDAICSMNGNIAACSQTVVQGYFTLIMIVHFQEAIAPEDLVAQIQGAPENHRGFQVMVSPVEPTAAYPPGQGFECFVVTAFGRDKPGIIHRFTQYLADKDINITDLYGDLRGDDFVLITQVEVPTDWSVSMIQADLETMGDEEGFTVRFQHENVFVATNQLRLSRG